MNRRKIYLSIALVLTVSFLFYSFRNDDKISVKTELYFGQSRNDGGEVTPEEWQAFADTVITAYFPNGSTTFDAGGRWMNGYGAVISERSKMVVLINEMAPDISARIDSVREKYKRYHHQDAVLRVDQRVEISF